MIGRAMGDGQIRRQAGEIVHRPAAVSRNYLWGTEDPAGNFTDHQTRAGELHPAARMYQSGLR